MRNLLFLIVLASLTSEKLVESAECAHLLYRYYSCKNLNFTIEGPTDVDPNEYFNINGKLDDAFFEKKLSPVHSFGSAMNFFRRIYTEMRDCNTDVCRCARQRADGSHFGSIFTNSGHFAFLKLLTSQIKAKYNQRAFNKTEFENNYFELPMSVSSFCFKNDFSISMLYFYNETSECISQSISNVSKKCFDDNLAEELAHRHAHAKIDEIPSEKLETYTRCLLRNVQCANDVKHFLAVNLLANYPSIIRGNMESYVEYLLTNNSELNPSIIG